MPTSDAAASSWPTAFRALADKRHTLLLQGPMGWFFHDLARVLLAQGRQVTKVHFNGGDALFWRLPGAVPYTGRHEALRAWLAELIRSRRIDAVALFGQMRPIHVVAREVAREMGVNVFVFEEGYLRPNYVTVERRGVNALSRLPRTASFYAQDHPDPIQPPAPTGQTLWRTALVAAAYGSAAALMRPRYRHAVHHRDLHPVREPARWLRGLGRQMLYRWTERGEQARLCAPDRSKRWFLVPLQVQGDSQVVHHSRFGGIEPFIVEVMESFARHAPDDHWLVIKHHPMDRPYTHHGRLIAAEAERLGLAGRVRYIHDQHLPTLLDHARGVVTINSTVGLQALHHRAPVITLGESVYGIPGLVHEGPLDDFWREPGVVNHELYRRFRNHLVAHTQLNASFYAGSPALRRILSRPPAPAPAAAETRFPQGAARLAPPR